jgi:hypothetical protein
MSTDYQEFELETKPDVLKSMVRIEAWYSFDIIDRVPVRFHRHNAQFEHAHKSSRCWSSLKDKWFDTEYRVESYINTIQEKTFRGETFPVFDPNLGPDIFQAFCGQPLEFGEVTSWTHPLIDTKDDLGKIKLDYSSIYFQKIEELTLHALERCESRYYVGYTDLHPGMDFVASWRGNDRVCMDFYLNPELLRELIDIAARDFQEVYDYFHSLLSEKGQPSVNWLGVPSKGKLHVPSCDFSTLIGPELFDEYCLPILHKEVRSMDRNIFHLDGRGVAKHIDSILTIPEIEAIQWVQGVGEDQSIAQWLPLINKLQSVKMPVIVDVALDELEWFIDNNRPEGLFLWVGTSSDEEEELVLKRLESWK